MIKVLENGNTLKVVRCTECGCIFQYTKADVIEHNGIINCPECKNEISK